MQFPWFGVWHFCLAIIGWFSNKSKSSTQYLNFFQWRGIWSELNDLVRFTICKYQSEILDYRLQKLNLLAPDFISKTPSLNFKVLYNELIALGVYFPERNGKTIYYIFWSNTVIRLVIFLIIKNCCFVKCIFWRFTKFCNFLCLWDSNWFSL